MMLRNLIITACLSFLGLQLDAQNPINTWKDYLNYSRTIDIDLLGQDVYAAAENGVYIYHQSDNSIERLSRVNGLSDIGISLLKTYPEKNLIVIGYSNGNIDLIQDKQIVNYPEIKNSTVVGDKSIRHITFYENTAFISTGVGIQEFDLERIEIRDSFTINAEGDLSIYETTILNDTLYAATTEGLFAGSLNQDLTIFSNWIQDLSIPEPFGLVRNCATYAGSVYINIPQPDPNGTPLGLFIRDENGDWVNLDDEGDIKYLHSAFGKLTFTNGYYAEVKKDDGVSRDVGIYEYEPGDYLRAGAVLAQQDGIIWIADYDGLKKRYTDGTFETIAPDGPASNDMFDLDFRDGKLWVASGAPARPGLWSNGFVWQGFYRFENDNWNNYTRESFPQINDDTFIDVCKVYIDPTNTSRTYVGSYFSGMYEMENEEGILYDNTNSSLDIYVDYDDAVWVGVAGFVRDKNNNLWVTNPQADRPLSVMRTDGEWENFILNGVLGSSNNLLDIIADDSDQLWMIINKTGIAVFKEGEDGENDQAKKLTAVSGNGGLPTSDVYCLSKDLDGEIWVGTADGVAVYYSPFDILSDRPSDARRILVEQDGVFQYLLEGQGVSSIAIDGANRKWIGTFGAGLFLMSPDGTEQIARYTSENSPLISNVINDIVIDNETGEVIIATQKGLMSYFSDATSGKRENNCTSVFPNPVRENYEGPISITGLMRDSEVKITDSRGNLVNKMISNGGTAIWDGKNTDGVRVATGVYFALSANVDGDSKCVSKILVVK